MCCGWIDVWIEDVSSISHQSLQSLVVGYRILPQLEHVGDLAMDSSSAFGFIQEST